MASREKLVPLRPKQVVEADHVNAIYNILNGSYSNTRGSVTETATRGNGMSVRLTNFDGNLDGGVTDITSYALEVRNREATNQRTVAFRRSDNKVVSEVTGGLLKAVADTGSGTTPTQVVVYGTPAGGVLSGTYPNPSFYLSEEFFRVYPYMTMAWSKTRSVTSRTDGFGGFNNEVTEAPGWVFCEGQTVTMRDGTVYTVPDTTGKYLFGVDGSHSLKTAFGNSMATQAAIDVTHTHSLNSHTHTVASHQHTMANHVHSLNGHTHDISHSHLTPAHAHSLNGHTHGLASHTHTLEAHTHTQSAHSHSLNGHTHGGNFNWESHTHTAGTYQHSHTHTLTWSHTHNASGGTLNTAHTHGGTASSTGTSTSNQIGASTSGTTGAANQVTYDPHHHTFDVSASFTTSSQSTTAVTGTTGDVTTSTTSGPTSDASVVGISGTSGDSSAAGAASGSTTTGPSPTTTPTDGGTSTGAVNGSSGANGPVPATSDPASPTTTATDGSGVTITGSLLTSGPNSGNTGVPVSNTSDGTALTTDGSIGSTGAATRSSIDATPRGMPLSWIFKL